MKKNLLHRSIIGGTISGGSNEYPIDINNYLTIEALEDGLTVSLSRHACEYCVDGDGNWKTLSLYTTTESINSGQTLSFRGNCTGDSVTGIDRFYIHKKCNLKGNCMSMLFGEDAMNHLELNDSYVFKHLFWQCSNIITVSKNFLPATKLTRCCYEGMFEGCTSLTTAPELPATTLADYCYTSMFSGCKALEEIPNLPAQTTTMGCYSSMFKDCINITSAVLPAQNLFGQVCYRNMFSGCTGLKKITLHGMTVGHGNGTSASYFYWIGEGRSFAPSVPDVGTLEVSSYASFEISGFDTRNWLGLPDTWNVVQKDFNNNFFPIKLYTSDLYPSSETYVKNIRRKIEYIKEVIIYKGTHTDSSQSTFKSYVSLDDIYEKSDKKMSDFILINDSYVPTGTTSYYFYVGDINGSVLNINNSQSSYTTWEVPYDENYVELK